MTEADRPSATFLDCIGTGDAFGAGGRFHTYFHLRANGRTFLLDCGASALIGLKRQGLDPARVDGVVLTHFHSDHFGPLGTNDRLTAAWKAMFPGSTRDWKRSVEIIEAPSGRSIERNGATFCPLPVVHTPGTNPHGLRIEVAGHVG